MKYLLKSLDLLEYVVNAETRTITPTEAARECGIDYVTTVRFSDKITRHDNSAGPAPGETDCRKYSNQRKSY